MNEMINNFASEVTGQPFEKLTIEQSVSGLFDGLGSPAFLVFNKEERRLLAVIKVRSNQEVDLEIKGLLVLKKLNMKRCWCPEVLKMQRLENQQSLLALSPALGRAISQYAEEDLVTFNLSVIETAKGLAELHSQSLVDESIQNEEVVRARRNVVEQYLLEIKLYLTIVKPFLPEANLSGINAIANLELRNRFDISQGHYVHGDFNPGNIFYQKGGDHVTMIDNGLVISSVDEKTGAPIGRASYDFVYFQIWVEVLGLIYQIDANEIEKIRQEFERTYFASGIKRTPQFIQEMEFMVPFICLKYILELHIAITQETKSLSSELKHRLMDFLCLKLCNINFR